MIVFGDAEPEDAWHPDDPLPELLDNLSRRLDRLGERRTLPAGVGEAVELEELELRLHNLILRREDLAERLRHLVDLAAQDIAFVRTRLEAR